MVLFDASGLTEANVSPLQVAIHLLSYVTLQQAWPLQIGRAASGPSSAGLRAHPEATAPGIPGVGIKASRLSVSKVGCPNETYVYTHCVL